MTIKDYIFGVVVLALFMGPKAQADPATSQEYQLKAAFLYNFIKFVDWPDETSAGDKPIIIGIIGKDPFGGAFEPMKDKLAKKRKVIVKRFKGLNELEKSSQMDKSGKHPQIEDIRECNLLFICSSEKEKLKETLDLLKDRSVLTVADMQGFLKAGGIVNFVIEENKIGFEINVAAAKQAKLEIRSNLLRLAKRIVGEDVAKKP